MFFSLADQVANQALFSQVVALAPCLIAAPTDYTEDLDSEMYLEFAALLRHFEIYSLFGPYWSA